MRIDSKGNCGHDRAQPVKAPVKALGAGTCSSLTPIENNKQFSDSV
jgi:hypothetical protein